MDPITLEVIRNALVAYSDEMATVLCRTAYNTMIYETRDYCVGLVDPEGGIIAQNPGGLPIFLADLGVAVKAAIDSFGEEGFAPGDVIISNDPYVCGQHLNNIVIFTPFFYEGELVAFPAVRGHWVDVGGCSRGFGSTASKEIYEEGLQFKSIKLYRGGECNTEVLKLIKDNIRYPESSFGDLRAQITACRLGERRLNDLFEKYGKETVRSCIQAIWDSDEQLSRSAVREIKNGEYVAETYLDNDGLNDEQILVRVRVIIQESEMIVDFSEINEEVEGAMNSGRSGGIAAAKVAFKCVTAPFSPVNEGAFRPLKVILPEGKFLSAKPPAPLGGWSLSLPTVIDTILKALSQAIPHKIPAGHKGCMGGYTLYGTDVSKNSAFICMNIFGGGWGAKPHADGENAAVSVCQGNVRNVPVELQEAYYPLLITKHQLREDSGGAGKFRGGLGVEVQVKSELDLFVNTSFERTKCPPWGLQGGKEGKVNDAVVLKPDCSARRILKVNSHKLSNGSVVTFLSGGGGGFGNPLERHPNSVLNDCLDGYTSFESAKNEYGVVITPETLTVDKEATENLREKMKNTSENL